MTRLEPHPDVLTRSVGDDLVLVQLDRSEIFSLNPTGARLWRLLMDGESVSDAVSLLLSEYDVDETALRAEVEALVSNLANEGLLRPTA